MILSRILTGLFHKEIHPMTDSRTLDTVRADITAAKVADEAAQAALDAATLVKQQSADALKVLVAEGRSILDAADAEFSAIEADIAGVVAKVETAVEAAAAAV